MTERRTTEPFEARFADRVRAYTDPATVRGIDALAMSRNAMSSGHATDRSHHRIGSGWLGRGMTGDRWAVAFMAVLVSVVGIAVIGRRSDSGIGPQSTPSASSGGAIPDVLRHAWQRPLPTVPDQVLWPTAFLSLVSEQLEFGPEPGPAASRSAIALADIDLLAVTATVETIGCGVGDVGLYHWSMAGKDTVMNLTAVGPDACAAREEALAGQWVRSDLPPPTDPEARLLPGTHQTSSFDPLGDPARPSRMSFAVPAGWKVKVDEPQVFVLDHLADAAASEPAADAFLVSFVQPRMMAQLGDAAACGPSGEAAGVGSGVNDLVEAIMALPGVVSTAPKAVTIGGYEGKLLDLHLAPSVTGACVGPDGQVGGVPVLRLAGSETGPVVGVGPDHPVRLILLDLTSERTMAIAIFDIQPSQQAEFEAHAARVMPIVESFEFHPPTP